MLMKKISMGGQAVIEGVMMRGKNAYSIVVRKANGELVVHKEKLENFGDRFPHFKLPILRGCVALVESLILGMKALSFSANQAMEDEMEKEENSEEKKESVKPDQKKENPTALSTGEMLLTMLTAFGMGFAMFFLLPLFLTNILKTYFDVLEHNILYNFIDGILRIFIFGIYIYLISKINDIQRVFQYHGAEHKAVFNFESEDPLTLDNARKFSTLHPRCGTSFLLFIMVISIMIFTFIPKEITIVQKAMWRLILIPLISGISYELIKLSGANSGHPIVNLIVKPGMWLQKLTTREPSDDQIDVAIAAINEVLTLENSK